MRTLFAVFCVATAMAAPNWAAEDFTGTKELRLVNGDLGSPKAKTVVITDKAKIEKLLATIKLEKKEPCACDHIQHAIFVKDKGEITVSLCDHCFDVGKATYRMPPEFYKLYTAYWREASAPQSNDSQKPGDAGKAAAQPAYTSYYTGQITAIGKGTLHLHVMRGHSGIIHPVNVDEKTVVVLSDGKVGKLTDLKVGQWIKVYWNPDPNDPKQQRIVKIEPGVAPWAAQPLAHAQRPADPQKAATAEVVVRGTLKSDAAGPGKGGWPTYTMTVTQVFKTAEGREDRTRPETHGEDDQGVRWAGHALLGLRQGPEPLPTARPVGRERVQPC